MEARKTRGATWIDRLLIASVRNYISAFVARAAREGARAHRTNRLIAENDGRRWREWKFWVGVGPGRQWGIQGWHCRTDNCVTVDKPEITGAIAVPDPIMRIIKCNETEGEREREREIKIEREEERGTEEGEKFVNSVSVFFFLPFFPISLSFYETMIIRWILHTQRRHVPVSKIFLNISIRINSRVIRLNNPSMKRKYSLARNKYWTCVHESSWIQVGRGLMLLWELGDWLIDLKPRGKSVENDIERLGAIIMRGGLAKSGASWWTWLIRDGGETPALYCPALLTSGLFSESLAERRVDCFIVSDPTVKCHHGEWGYCYFRPWRRQSKGFRALSLPSPLGLMCRGMSTSSFFQTVLENFAR